MSIWLVFELIFGMLGLNNHLHKVDWGYDPATYENYTDYEFPIPCRAPNDAPPCHGFLEIRTHDSKYENVLTITIVR